VTKIDCTSNAFIPFLVRMITIFCAQAELPIPIVSFTTLFTRLESAAMPRFLGGNRDARCYGLDSSSSTTSESVCPRTNPSLLPSNDQ
jgi:hypothetical protein